MLFTLFCLPEMVVNVLRLYIRTWIWLRPLKRVWKLPCVCSSCQDWCPTRSSCHLLSGVHRCSRRRAVCRESDMYPWALHLNKIKLYFIYCTIIHYELPIVTESCLKLWACRRESYSSGAGDRQLKCKSKIFVMQIHEKNVELIENAGLKGRKHL